MQHVTLFEHLIYIGQVTSLTCATKTNILASRVLHPEDKGALIRRGFDICKCSPKVISWYWRGHGLLLVALSV